MNDIELPAGHELDRLIAEKVMGWTWAEYGFYHTGPVQCVAGTQWNPSTDPRDTLQVVERFQRRGWGFALTAYPTSADAEPGPRFAAAVFAEHHTATAYGDTAPLAICCAALKALS